MANAPVSASSRSSRATWSFRATASSRRRVIGAALAISSGLTGFAQTARRIDIVLPDNTRVSAEVAATEAEREQGLMNRRSLNPNAGMLFIFDRPGPYEFWMKNTLIPLDMLWLNKAGKVVSLSADVPPCKADPCPTYPPTAPADYVLEVTAGYAKTHGLKVGDTLDLKDLKALKAMDPVRP